MFFYKVNIFYLYILKCTVKLKENIYWIIKTFVFDLKPEKTF